MRRPVDSDAPVVYRSSPAVFWKTLFLAFETALEDGEVWPGLREGRPKKRPHPLPSRSPPILPTTRVRRPCLTQPLRRSVAGMIGLILPSLGRYVFAPEDAPAATLIAASFVAVGKLGTGAGVLLAGRMTPPGCLAPVRRKANLLDWTRLPP